jgi:hypothetical protein
MRMGAGGVALPDLRRLLRCLVHRKVLGRTLAKMSWVANTCDRLVRLVEERVHMASRVRFVYADLSHRSVVT